MRTFGDTNRFALAFELRADPDASGAPHLRASWGAFQMWVGGRNLTAGTTASGHTVDAAEVPLAPIIEWLVEVWDPLLHEERLPQRTKSPSAARWRLDCLAPLPADEGELDALLERREVWWRRHGLGSALPGYRIRDLHIRRAGDDVEISWDDREWRSLPGGVRLMETPGRALVPAGEAASVLHRWAKAVADAMKAHEGAGDFVSGISKRLAEIAEPGSMSERLKYAAGQRLDHAATEIRRLAGVTGGSVEETVHSLLGLEDHQGAALVAPMTVPVMLYRSASPALTSADLLALLRLTRDLPPDSGALRGFRHPERPPDAWDEITQDGCDRALEFRTASGIPEDAALLGEWDLETVLLPDLGVRVEDIRLDDTGVDGVAVAAPGRAPTIAVNKSGRFSSTAWGRRMTLAHELCHLLFDVASDGRVGLVSSSWAPYPLERRANAFAAMLILPPEALSRFLCEDPERWTPSDLRQAMRSLGVGRSTLTWQLYNLRWITASERGAWLDAL